LAPDLSENPIDRNWTTQSQSLCANCWNRVRSEVLNDLNGLNVCNRAEFGR